MLPDLSRRPGDVVLRASCGFLAAPGAAFQQEHVRTAQGVVLLDGIPAEAVRCGKPAHAERPDVPARVPFRAVLLHVAEGLGERLVLRVGLPVRGVA